MKNRPFQSAKNSAHNGARASGGDDLRKRSNKFSADINLYACDSWTFCVQCLQWLLYACDIWMDIKREILTGGESERER